MQRSIHWSFLVLLVLVAIVCSVSEASRGSRGHNRKLAKAIQTETHEDTTSSSSSGEDGAKQRIFTLLVEHTFDPQTRGHAELYYKTRFFAAHLQARMRYIETQYDLNAESVISKDGSTKSVADDSEQMGLTQTEADDLNNIMREMWLASRKLYQNWGCLSYDLTLCSGQTNKGHTLTDSEKAAMLGWEKRLSTPFSTSKSMSREDAQEIHDLMESILAVLLSAGSMSKKSNI